MELKKISQEIYNPVSENVKKLAELFPAAVKDGQVDFEALKQELGQFEEVGKEKYELTWPGKTLAKQLANLDIVGRTLKYVPEDSKNPETTENLYIEGDNLEVLKLLRNSYYGKIKMIYIDPPYNTGNDFVYKDDYSKLKEISDIEEGEVSEDGERLIKNQKSSARFHSNWLNMMYPRLKVAKDLLTDDGVIFISIDDNEVDNLRKICDEIFGRDNFISTIVWEKIHTRKNSAKYFSESHDYIVCYAKQKVMDSQSKGWIRNLLRREDTNAYSNPDNDPRGPWKHDPIYANNPYDADYTITKPNGIVLKRPQGKYWRYSEDTIKQAIVENRIIWGNGDSYPTLKRFLCDVQDGLVPTTIFKREFAGDNSFGNNELKNLFGIDKIFSYPKPSKLIERLLEIGSNKTDIILDFFSGSATTAHAVMQLNAEDGGKRKFIMVQLPEPCPEDSEAYKAGFKTIADIGKERIRRAGEKIKEEFKDKEGIENLDIGFKSFPRR
jgi:DNA methylase.